MAALDAMCHADEESDPDWREKISPVGIVVDTRPMSQLFLGLHRYERIALTRWMRGAGYPSIAEMLRAAISALLDANEVSPEEVPLTWRS